MQGPGAWFRGVPQSSPASRSWALLLHAGPGLHVFAGCRGRTAHAGPDHTDPCDFTSSMAAIVHAGPGWLLFVDGTALLVHVGLTQRDSSPSRPCKPRFACRAVVLLHAGPSSHEFVRSQQLLFKQARLGMYSQEYQGWCGRSGPRGPEFTRNPAIRAALVHAGPNWHGFAVGAALLVHVGAS